MSHKAVGSKTVIGIKDTGKTLAGKSDSGRHFSAITHGLSRDATQPLAPLCRGQSYCLLQKIVNSLRAERRASPTPYNSTNIDLFFINRALFYSSLLELY